MFAVAGNLCVVRMHRHAAHALNEGNECQSMKLQLMQHARSQPTTYHNDANTVRQ